MIEQRRYWPLFAAVMVTAGLKLLGHVAWVGGDERIWSTRGMAVAWAALIVASLANAERFTVLSSLLITGFIGLFALYVLSEFFGPFAMQSLRSSIRAGSAGCLFGASLEAAMLTDWSRQPRRLRERMRRR